MPVVPGVQPHGSEPTAVPHCDNRYQESLGYFLAEDDPHYRVQYCRLCKMYFKLIDPREYLDDPYCAGRVDHPASGYAGAARGWRQPLPRLPRYMVHRIKTGSDLTRRARSEWKVHATLRAVVFFMVKESLWLRPVAAPRSPR